LPIEELRTLSSKRQSAIGNRQLRGLGGKPNAGKLNPIPRNSLSRIEKLVFIAGGRL
jgi:hypothetical protein